MKITIEANSVEELADALRKILEQLYGPPALPLPKLTRIDQLRPLGVDTRTINALKAERIETIAEAREYGDRVREIPNLGRKSYRLLVDALAELDRREQGAPF